MQTLAQKVVEAVYSCDSYQIVEPFAIGQGVWRNELLLFIKPEVFLVKNTKETENSVNLVLEKLKQFDAHPEGVLVVGGRVLDEMEIMNNHYGFINKLSRSASKILDDDSYEKIKQALQLTSLDEYEVLGGHEYLAKYSEEDCFGLDELWFTKKSIKIRSGFYIQSYDKDGKRTIIVNGFHPAQLSHFTAPSHRIVLILVHSNTDWSVLRNNMIGATFPEKAAPESIRGTLYSHPKDYGLEEVTIANNAVHLSAGAFEGLFEINNFFGKILKTEIEKEQPLIVQKMIDAGIDFKHVLNSLHNPLVLDEPKQIDLFTATEDKDTEEAVFLYKESLSR